MRRYIMIHPTDGIFVGFGMGFAFFTLCDSVGQSTVSTFDSADEGRKMVNEHLPSMVGICRFEPIETVGTFATIAELKTAGFESLLGEMEADALRYAEPAGHA